jgi:hypothetical protein
MTTAFSLLRCIHFGSLLSPLMPSEMKPVEQKISAISFLH